MINLVAHLPIELLKQVIRDGLILGNIGQSQEDSDGHELRLSVLHQLKITSDKQATTVLEKKVQEIT